MKFTRVDDFGILRRVREASLDLATSYSASMIASSYTLCYDFLTMERRSPDLAAPIPIICSLESYYLWESARKQGFPSSSFSRSFYKALGSKKEQNLHQAYFSLTPFSMRVNRGACCFGRYKNPRRPCPPPCAGRVRYHPLQVSAFTLAHHRQSILTYSHPPPSARPIKSTRAGPSWASG
jgi:hypothetical protein